MFEQPISTCTILQFILYLNEQMENAAALNIELI